MSVDTRIDYFRSEIKGEMAKLEKLMAEQHTQHLQTLREFEKRLEAFTRQLRDLEMSVR